MAFDVLKKIDLTILSFFEIHPSPQVRRALHAFTAGAFIILMVLASWWAYGSYSVYREQQAQKTLASCIEQYEKAVTAGVGSILWPTVELSCKSGYEQYSGSSLAPYFLAYQAEALIKQNKTEDAMTVMGTMTQAMSHSSPLYYLYAMKHALLQMDAADSAVRAAGLQTLTKLADDTDNKQRDEALYYVGLYNWHNNDLAQAKEAWQKLAELPAMNNDQASPWASMVAGRLKLLA